MPTTSESLVKCFERDEMDLSLAMLVDFGFLLLSEVCAAKWFALLKDFFDILVTETGHEQHGSFWEKIVIEGDPAEASVRRAATAKLHSIVIKGKLVPEVIAAAERLPSWPRYKDSETAHILAVVHENDPYK